MKTLHLFVLLSLIVTTTKMARAQSTWTGAGADQNWSTSGNWSGGVPSGGAVTFPDGAFPITTNVAGAVNNIVSANTAITTLGFNNNGAISDFDTTLIPSGVTLTASGNVTIGAAAVAVSAAFVGGGSLVAGTGTSTLACQSTSGTATLDLSKLTNFVFNSGGAGGPVSLSTGSSSATGKINLAGGSNSVTATVLSLGNNNTGGTGTMNLGNGTNNLFADTFSIGIDKTTGIMQFLNNAGGGLKIASHTGTGRATITAGGAASSGSTSASDNGSLLFNGGTVNILASTLTLGNRTTRVGGGSANGVLSYNSGVVDATTINLAVNTTGGAGNGTISVGGGTLVIGSGSMSMANEGGTAGAGTLIVTNGGSVICSNHIYKATVKGTATITLSGANLTLQSTFGTIGVSNGIPIDIFNITNSILTLPVATSANIAVVAFNPDATTQNTINVSSMPSITAYPSQFPIISYQNFGGNLNSLVLGTLPSTFTGYISNNAANFTMDLVITNGPSTAKADQWGGGVNNQWDTASQNWTNAGVAVKYNDLDFVTFDDLAQTSVVNLTGTRQPATLVFNNSVLNYTLTGTGKISGPVNLAMNGGASLTLAETGGDNFSGGIQVNSGKLVLDDASSAIAGGLIIGGGATVQIGLNDGSGALPAGPLDDEGTLIFSRSNAVSVATIIPGGGGLTQNGNGTLTLTVVNTFTGGTTVSNGTLALTGSGSIATSGSVSVTNATLDVSGVTTSATLNTVSLGNATLNVKVGYLQTNLFINGGLTLSGSANTINVRSLPPIASYPATVTLLSSPNGITGYNFVLGTLPAASPAYAGTISESGDQTSVLLTLTSGPIGTRPSVTWSGVDALGNISTNWTDAQNWITPGVPGATEKVTFNNTGGTGGSPFDVVGDGNGGVVNPIFINNIVDANLTNAALTYANDSSADQNTGIAAAKTLTVNGSLTVSGAGSTVTVLGVGGAMQVNSPGGTLSVENATAPTLDMSGLGAFTGTVSQIGIGFNPASAGSRVNGNWYLARTNVITGGAGSFGTGSSLVVGGGTGSTAGAGQVYLGQSNVLYLDGIDLGASTSTGSLIEFNPVLTGNPVAYVRGISGNASRVSVWTLGDDTVNINNGVSGSGFINDFSAGTLNALVNTLVVGQGAHGNIANVQVKGTFTMAAGTLDVTTLKIGAGGIGTGGAGLGVMNVNGGTLIASTLGLGVNGDGGGLASTAGTLNLSNATLVVSNGITLGTGTAGGTLNCVAGCTVKLLNGTIGTPTTLLTTLGLDGGTLQFSVNGSAPSANIAANNVTTTAATTTINLAAISGVSGTVQIPLISYVSGDPFSTLTLGAYPSGYTVTLVDNTANSSVDVSVTSLVKPTPHITGVSVSGTTLTLSATNGANGGQFVLLSTTDLTKPLNQWTPVLTSNFDGSGNLNLSTNIINPSVPQQFYILAQ